MTINKNLKADYRTLFLEAEELEIIKYYHNQVLKGDIRDKVKIQIEWIVANAKSFRDNFVKAVGFDPLV